MFQTDECGMKRIFGYSTFLFVTCGLPSYFSQRETRAEGKQNFAEYKLNDSLLTLNTLIVD